MNNAYPSMLILARRKRTTVVGWRVARCCGQIGRGFFSRSSGRVRFALVVGLVGCLLGGTYESNAQTKGSVGIGTDEPNPHAVLDLTSGNQGFLVPRLSTEQRDALATYLKTSVSPSPAGSNGLMVFDSDDALFYYWKNPQWIELGTGTINGGTAGQFLQSNGAVAPPNWVDAPGFQSLSLVGNTLSISNGGTGVTLPDASTTNEQITNIGLVGNILTITEGAVDKTVDLSSLAGGGGGVISVSGSNPISVVGPANTPTVSIATDGTTIGVSSLQQLQLLDNAVTTDKLANASVTDVKISALSPAKLTQQEATDGQVLKWNGFAWVAADDNGQVYSQGAGISINGGIIANTGDTDPANDITKTTLAGGDLTGTYPDPTIGNGKVTSAKIADGSVTNVDVSAAAAIATSKIAGPLTEIPDNGLGGLATLNNVDSDRIVNGSIQPVDVASPGISNQILGTDGTGVVKWINQSALPSGGGSVIATRYHSIGAAAFVPTGEYYDKVRRNSNGGEVAVTTSDADLVAPVSLPHGATITKVACYLQTGINRTFILYRKPVTGDADQVVTSIASGVAGSKSEPVSGVNAITDNNLYTYRVNVVGLGDGDRIYSVVIEYTEVVGGAAVADGQRMGGAINVNQPPNPQNGMLWLDTNPNKPVLKQWDGAKWNELLKGKD